MTIFVGYTPTPDGRAALSTVATEARKSGRPQVVVAHLIPIGSPCPVLNVRAA